MFYFWCDLHDMRYMVHLYEYSVDVVCKCGLLTDSETRKCRHPLSSDSCGHVIYYGDAVNRENTGSQTINTHKWCRIITVFELFCNTAQSKLSEISWFSVHPSCESHVWKYGSRSCFSTLRPAATTLYGSAWDFGRKKTKT